MLAMHHSCFLAGAPVFSVGAMAKTWKQKAFKVGLGVAAWLARSRWSAMSFWFGRRLGDLTLLIQRGRPQNTLQGVGREWQRMFPTKRMVPIVGQDDQTVYAEIHTHCPLRGTGDTKACYRMMAYDRRMLETIGGQLVVLQSQAEPGRTCCSVAIRVTGASVEDLSPAHER